MGASGSIHVLHVDDEPEVADLAAEYLEREDDRLSVETATSASEGLDLLDEHDYDCIVSDYDMPRLGGIEFLDAVREDYPDLPFILYTGKGSEEVASEAISVGVTDYLQKGGGTSQYEVLVNRIANAVDSFHTERALETTRRRYEKVVEQNLAGIYIIQDGEFVYVNPRLAEIHGYERDAIIGMSPLELVAPEERDRVREKLRKRLNGEVEDVQYQTVGLRKDGESIDIELHGSRMEHNGKPAIIGAELDITKRKERERELERFKEVVEQAGQAVYITDTDGTIEYVNPAFEQITGYTSETAVGQNPRILKSGEKADDYYEDLWETVLAGDVWEEEVINRRQSGERYHAHQTIAPIIDEAGEPTAFVAIQTDITDRKERRQELEALEAKYRSIIEDVLNATAVGTIILNADFEVVWCSKAGADFFGIDRDTLIGTDKHEILREEIAPSMENPDRFAETVLDTYEDNSYTEQFECHVLAGVGRAERWLEHRSQPIETGLFEGGRVEIYTDVTDRKERERELQRHEAYLEQSRDIITVVDANGSVQFQSASTEQTTGFSPEEVIGQEGFEFVHPDDREKVTSLFRSFVAESETEASVELRVETTDGSWRWVEARGVNKLDDPLIEGIIVSSRDITERKKREHAFERLHVATRDLMRATASEEVAKIGSETATQVLEVSMNGIHLFDEYADALVPVAWADRSEELLDGSPPSLPVEDSVAGRAYRTGDPESYGDLHKAEEIFNQETPFRSELYLPLGDHGVFILSSTTPHAFDSTDEALANVLATNVEAALDRVEQREQLRRERDRLDEFASVVSHDLRNPLNVAEGRLDLATEDCDSEHLEAVEQAHARMGTLIDDVLSLARAGETVGEMETVKLGDLVDACWQTVETASATLVADTETAFQADKTRLQQLLENLLRNAVEHGGEDVTITIGDLPDGFYVEDDGPGIPEDERGNVFDAGYSMAGKGTGFGLSIVREIAEAHDWEISVTASEAGGARFEITDVEVTTS